MTAGVARCHRLMLRPEALLPLHVLAAQSEPRSNGTTFTDSGTSWLSSSPGNCQRKADSTRLPDGDSRFRSLRLPGSAPSMLVCSPASADISAPALGAALPALFPAAATVAISAASAEPWRLVTMLVAGLFEPRALPPSLWVLSDFRAALGSLALFVEDFLSSSFDGDATSTGSTPTFCGVASGTGEPGVFSAPAAPCLENPALGGRNVCEEVACLAWGLRFADACRPIGDDDPSGVLSVALPPPSGAVATSPAAPGEQLSDSGGCLDAGHFPSSPPSFSRLAATFFLPLGLSPSPVVGFSTCVSEALLASPSFTSPACAFAAAFRLALAFGMTTAVAPPSADAPPSAFFLSDLRDTSVERETPPSPSRPADSARLPAILLLPDSRESWRGALACVKSELGRRFEDDMKSLAGTNSSSPQPEWSFTTRSSIEFALVNRLPDVGHAFDDPAIKS
mmetsp:Transcript_12428/g.43854  ORF Transcript_12428/g.43854 Transcript_12428/m.43854 type:complete len:453 (-) Transcript_12428:897-2255(-)